MTKDLANLILQTKFDSLRFAWDMEKYESEVIKGLNFFGKVSKLPYRKMKVYVLVNYNTTFDYDLYRVYTLKKLGFDPYIMIYNKENSPRKLRLLARWVNNKVIFRSCERFEDYDCKRG